MVLKLGRDTTTFNILIQQKAELSEKIDGKWQKLEEEQIKELLCQKEQ